VRCPIISSDEGQLDLVVEQDEPALKVLDRHGHRRVVHEAAHARLALAQRPLRTLGHGRVDGDTADGRQIAVRIPDRELDLERPRRHRTFGEVHLGSDRLPAGDYFPLEGVDCFGAL
jgi:hypothetical protein